MNALTALHFDTADVRMIMRDGEPWWIGLDATSALEIARGRQALAALDDYEKDAYIIGTLGGPQETTIINESGLYSLILRSRKPVAKRFKKWLTTEVLPSIRKFGIYPPPSDQEIIANDPYDGREKRLSERFREERLRFEARRGKKLENVNGFSKHKIVAIENDMGGGRDPKLVMAMVLARMDALYVLSGDRQYSIWEQQHISSLRDVQHQMLLDAEIQKDTF